MSLCDQRVVRHALSRRRGLGHIFALGMAGAAWCAGPSAQAASWPSRPIRLVVPWPPGGAADALCRAIGQEMQKSLGVPVVVENRPGATGTLGSEQVRRMPADGHTLLLVNTLSHALQPVTNRALPYDALRDFAPIGVIATVPVVLGVHPSLPVNNYPELIEYARRNSGKLNMASPGVGTGAHFFGLLLRQRAGIDLTLVPYQGDPAALKDFLAGETQVWMSGGLNLAWLQEGKVRPIATMGTERWYKLPAVPTMVELGMRDMVAISVMGLAVAAGTPDPIVGRLNGALNSALTSPEVGSLLENLGQVRGGGAPRVLWEWLEQTIVQFRGIAEQNRLKFD